MIQAGIVGATGYTGVELLRLLSSHPEIEVVAVSSDSEAGRPVADVHPHLRAGVDLAYIPHQQLYETECAVVFFAAPNGTAMQQVPALLEQGRRVIDLAADFRLRDPQVWESYYQMPHACPELLEEAVYGLPELNRAQVSQARLVANPGCYPTAVILGLLPLLESAAVDLDHLVADAKSGISGAGRQASTPLLMSEAMENFRAYGVHQHRHGPEIAQALGQAAGETVQLTFTPHVAPMIRGILATLYAWTELSGEAIQELYEQCYDAEPFVDVMPPESLPQTKNVRGSNVCRIALHPGEGEPLIVLSAIDNLIKGAAGQAIQNMNLMFGLPEQAGLPQIALPA
ncbi:MAG: N-acetyl-gamma-glutamyl-phosphate reductase [Gammaproteobacteria bacterium]|nr:N-acetyl-gamma-glutamyl-phosphate reductase [Gammaproteobacteria bacterium]MDE0612112.1 N-acetyl-gamma-glutamyl-phosphate reductase [Gammaproteobacteria bacterium]